VPSAVHQAPLLNASRSLGGGGGLVPIDRGSDECAVAFVANVESVRVGEEEPKRKRYWSWIAF
jgi:hypothetical protein